MAGSRCDDQSTTSCAGLGCLNIDERPVNEGVFGGCAGSCSKFLTPLRKGVNVDEVGGLKVWSCTGEGDGLGGASGSRGFGSGKPRAAGERKMDGALRGDKDCLRACSS